MRAPYTYTRCNIRAAVSSSKKLDVTMSKKKPRESRLRESHMEVSPILFMLLLEHDAIFSLGALIGQVCHKLSYEVDPKPSHFPLFEW